jgi:hypothetical protein
MTQSDLELLKENIDQIVEIKTENGENRLIKVISIFDLDSDSDVFFWDVTSDPQKTSSEQSEGFSLTFEEIRSVRKLETVGGRA